MRWKGNTERKEKKTRLTFRRIGYMDLKLM